MKVRYIFIGTALLVVLFVFIKMQIQSMVNTTKLSSRPIEQTTYKTNSWMSSLYSFPSAPVFALPGTYRISPAGIEIGLPTTSVSENTIYYSHTPTCTISPSSEIVSSSIQTYSDWTANINIITASSTLKYSITQGSPETWLESDEEISINCQEHINMQNGLLLIRRGDLALVIAAENGAIERESPNVYKLASNEGMYRFFVLPVATLESFSPSNYSRILATVVNWNVTGDIVSTQLSFDTDSELPMLTTLWPHHIPAKPFDKIGFYETHLGTLTLIEITDDLMLQNKTTVPSFTFEPVRNDGYKSDIVSTIKTDTQQIQQETAPVGVYFRGVWLGKLATLAQLADAYELSTEKELLLNLLEVELRNSISMFEYDEEKQMTIAKNPEFGNEKGNDHHFHYGYYLRALAVLVEQRPKHRNTYSEFGNTLMFDIANVNRENTNYPFIRNFSVYEGHSWADASANFGDGNNQESTSEAINAWYGVWMWSTVNQNKEMVATAEWLLSQEISATKSYWFGYNNPFPSEYRHSIASIIWGGKRDFGTWFSSELMHIYGIQFLPITPISTYLGDTAEISPAMISEMNGWLIGKNHEWEDLFIIYQSFYQPEEALDRLDSLQKFAGTGLESLTKHMVFKNLD